MRWSENRNFLHFLAASCQLEFITVLFMLVFQPYLEYYHSTAAKSASLFLKTVFFLHVFKLDFEITLDYPGLRKCTRSMLGHAFNRKNECGCAKANLRAFSKIFEDQARFASLRIRSARKIWSHLVTLVLLLQANFIAGHLHFSKHSIKADESLNLDAQWTIWPLPCAWKDERGLVVRKTRPSKLRKKLSKN